MGIRHLLNMLVNPKLRVEAALGREYAAYRHASETDGECPDPHVILAQVWLSHKANSTMIDPNEPSSRQRAFAQTWQLAVIPWPQNVRALGLNILHEERPNLIHKFPEYTRELNDLLAPVLKSRQSSEFLAQYEKTNPNVLYEASAESGTGWFFEPL